MHSLQLCSLKIRCGKIENTFKQVLLCVVCWKALAIRLHTASSIAEINEKYDFSEKMLKM